jgi:probable F420-dependent oxidoreductase
MLRDYVQTVEGLGFDHLLLPEHVLGASPEAPPDAAQAAAHTIDDPYHEPFVFLAWAAAHTQRLGLVTAVLVLPQRPTALVAKQAAELDLLSGGRLRLGVGVGWHEVEFEALDKDFHTRGRRIEAQIDLMRRLWSEPVVDIHDEWHTVSQAGISPRPGRSIPIWLGGMSEVARKRAARIADGWISMTLTPEDAQPIIERLHGYVRAAGRDPESFGVQGRMNVTGDDVGRQVEEAVRWRQMGATHLALTTGRMPLTATEQLQVLRRFKEAWEAVGNGLGSRQ